MALTQYEKLYEGDSINRVVLGLIYLRIPKTGTIKSIRIIGAGGAITGTWYFNVRLNGVAQFSGVNRPKFTIGDFDETKSGLSIAVVQGDIFLLDLEQKGSGGLTAPIAMIFDIEDGLPAEEPVVHTTASLANNATENTTVPLGKSYAIHKVSADKACRIRLYLTAAYRTADASRPIGTDPDNTTEHGVVMDIVLTAGNLTWDLAPIAHGSNREAVRSVNIPTAIENRSGSTGTVQVTFTEIVIEE